MSTGDVHSTNYTLCTYSVEDDKEFALAQFKPDHLYILRYIKRLKEQHGENTKVICGYEAGGLGYSLYRSLKECGVDCVIPYFTFPYQSIYYFIYRMIRRFYTCVNFEVGKICGKIL